MRIACSALLIAGAALFAGSSGAIAAPANGGAIRAAADEIGLSESVHCRPWRHPHRWGFGRGCGGPGVAIYERGPRFRHRFGVREEFRGGFRTRERAAVTIRGEDRGGFRGGMREGASVRGSTTFRGGGSGDVSQRGSRGGQAGATTNNPGGGQMNATGGNKMNSAPSANTGRSQGGGMGGSQQGGSQQGGGAQGGAQQKQ